MTTASPGHSRQDLQELRRIATDVARETAALVKERRRAGVEVADRKSSPTDVVTEVDHESEAFLRHRLHELRPRDGFVGEEGTGSDSSSGVTWVVDPIDGTVNFLYGMPHYAVSVAAVDDDQRSLAGAVVDVTRGEVFSAALGQGATLDAREIRVRPTPPLRERMVITGYQYQPAVRRLQAPAVARLVDQVRDVRRTGSAALDLCWVAAGRADAYVEEGLFLWDRAAAGLVAAEAGATVQVHTGVGGMDLVVAAPSDGFAAMWDLLVTCGFAASAD
jgi:myo-inositol-1(or 4)-monophosphatase